MLGSGMQISPAIRTSALVAVIAIRLRDQGCCTAAMSLRLSPMGLSWQSSALSER